MPRADKSAMGRIGQAKAKAAYRWGRPEDVLRRDPAITQRRVRNMVLRYDLIPYLCAICGSPPTWKGRPLVMILDHENGDPSDHRLENLRFVCPTTLPVTDLPLSLRRMAAWFDSRRKHDDAHLTGVGGG